MGGNSMEIHLNVTEICIEFGMRRENVQRLIAAAGLKGSRRETQLSMQLDPSPSTDISERRKYRLRELIPVLTGQTDEYRAKARAQTEEIEMRLAIRRGDLLERHDVEEEHARIFRLVALWADTAPDILERDCALSASQISRLERSLDQMRESLHQQLVSPDETDLTAGAAHPGRSNGHSLSADGRP